MALEFEDQQYARPTNARQPSKMAAFLIRHKLAKDNASANKILTISGILIIVISIYFFYLAYITANIKISVYNFPNELISRFPVELQEKIKEVLLTAKK